MKVWELRNILDEYDGELEVTVLDFERNSYELDKVILDYRNKDTELAIMFK